MDPAMAPKTAYRYRALVDRVIDGDTLVADVDLGFRLTFRVTVRLFGINAPEVRGPTRRAGIAAGERLRSLVETLWVTLDSCGLDKYGRSIAVVTTADGVNVNDLMVAEGHAVVYMAAAEGWGDDE